MLKRKDLYLKIDDYLLINAQLNQPTQQNNINIPFNLGNVVESLQNIGMSTDIAIKLARACEKHFLAEEKTPILLSELMAWLEQEIKRNHSSALAKRFQQQTPPFVLLYVEKKSDEGQSGEGQQESQQTSKLTPFKRGKLAKSLEPLGLSFKKAYALSRHIERKIRSEGARVVSIRELMQLVRLSLEMRYGRKITLKFEAETPQLFNLLIALKIDDKQTIVPFSRGVLARSLSNIGIAPDHAYQLAKQVEVMLWYLKDSQNNPLRQAQLNQTVYDVLREDLSQKIAKRYQNMNAFAESSTPLFILLGGAAGVGKSHIASEISYRLGITRIVSTDAIRQALRSVISKNIAPTLHSSSYKAWYADILPQERPQEKPKRKRVTIGFQSQIRQLSTPLVAILERNQKEMKSLVMEGIHLVPGFLPFETLTEVNIMQIVLTVSDEKAHKKRFAQRENETKQNRQMSDYLEHFTEIRTLNNFICKQAKHHKIPIVENDGLESTTQTIIDMCLELALKKL